MTLTVQAYCPHCSKEPTKTCTQMMEANEIGDHLGNGRWMIVGSDLDIVTKQAVFTLCQMLETKAIFVECGQTYDVWLLNPVLAAIEDSLRELNGHSDAMEV